jgi:ribosomal protein S20
LLLSVVALQAVPLARHHLEASTTDERSRPTLARTPRKWQGARNPSGLKRVRQADRRHAILAPRRSAAKTLVAKAVRVATVPTDGQDPVVALNEALSALDRAAKVGAIHQNAAARRKSRLTLKLNAVLGGSNVVTSAHVAKTTGKAAAAKAAKARIAAGKATKAKGAQTAAGKARAALSKTSRAESGGAAATEESTATTATTTRTKSSTSKATASKATPSKSSTSKAKADTAKKPAARAKKSE